MAILQEFIFDEKGSAPFPFRVALVERGGKRYIMLCWVDYPVGDVTESAVKQRLLIPVAGGLAGAVAQVISTFVEYAEVLDEVDQGPQGLDLFRLDRQSF